MLRVCSAQGIPLTAFHVFDDGSVTSDGENPSSNLIEGSDGSFYGTTQSGGSASGGTVFKLTPSGVLTILYSFSNAGGGGVVPGGGLIEASDGNFYGTTTYGGSAGNGTVFKLTPSGVETTLHSFGSVTGDGQNPSTSLIEGTDGNFYGTTPFGGSIGGGTAFRMTPSGVLTILHSFRDVPEGGLIEASDGNFYGTTHNSSGTVFRMTPSGTVTTLHSFGSTANDGTYPVAGLIQGTDGNFYGTTRYGGSTTSSDPNGAGYGTVFRMTLSGTVTILHSFKDGTAVNDGANPYTGLIEGSDGNFYGTAQNGGSNNGGAVFAMTPAGAVTTLHSFYDGSTVNDGYAPLAGLTLGSDGNFYGTTIYGGLTTGGNGFGIGYGTVFRLSIVQSSPLMSFTVSPATVVGGGKVTVTVKLTSPAPTGGETVTIQSNNAAVPSSQVMIAAGATSGSASILTGGVDASTAVTLTAAAGGVSKTAAVTVTPAALNALTVSPNPTYGGNNTVAAVLLNGLAGPSGIKAALSSSDGTTIPAGTIVNIPAGASKAAYTFIPAVVTTPTTMTITATAGAVNKTVVMTVNPAMLTTLIVPTTVNGGAIATIKATLSSPAPAGGLTVTIASSSPAISVGSGTIAIAAGATSGTLTATTIPVDSDTPVTVTATLGSVTKTASLTVKAASLSSLSVGPNPAYGGNKTTASVILTGKAGPNGLTVSLSSSDGTTIPAGTTLNIPAGAINAAYIFTPAVVTASTTTTITATLGAVSKSAVLTVNPAILTTLSASSVYSGQSDPIKATLSSPAPAGGLTVTVTSNSPAISVGSGTITIAAGATSGTLTATTRPVDSDTPVTLSASLGGVTKTASVVVKAATLLSMSISPNPSYGGNKTTAAIALNGQAGPSGLTVALSSSDATTIPPGTSVTIPAGAGSTSYSFTPAVVTAPKTVTITATQGAISKPVVLTINPAVLTTLGAASVYGGQAAAIKATLSSPAPAGGLTVTITSNSPALSVGSGTIAIAAGTTIGTLTATTAPVSSDTPVSLSASLGSVTKTASVVVKAPVLSSLIASPTSVQNGKAVTFKVILGSAAPTGGLAVSLSGGSTILPIPASITVPAGSSNAIATVTAAGATSSTQVSVTAALGSVTKTVTVTVSP